MRLIISFFRLVRLPNLLIVALTEWLLYDQLLVPAYQSHSLEPMLNIQQLFMLILAIIFVTGAGYIINDILDLPIDKINKPDRVIVNRFISEQMAYVIYFSFLLLGFLSSELLAFTTDKQYLLWMYPLATMGLYAYSYYFKKRPLTGNIIISLYCAGVAGLLWLAEITHLNALNEIAPQTAGEVTFILTLYMCFAFLSTLFREIIKDMEDVRGDNRFRVHTLPVVWGLKTSKRLASIIGLGLLITIVYTVFRLSLFGKWLLMAFVLLLIVVPLIWTLIGLQSAVNQRHFHRLSGLAKIVMVSGIILLILIAI